MPAPPLTTYTAPLTGEQVKALRQLLESSGFEFSPKPYTIYFAQKNKLSVAVYEKGPKVLLQGKGIDEFVSFELEPKILGEARLGYEEVHAPEMFEPHFGIDESGKGDFFGPLVIAGAYHRSRDCAHLSGKRDPGQQTDRFGREDSLAREDDPADAGGRDRCRADRTGAVQRSLRKVRQPEQPPRLGPRPGDRKPARATTRLSARALR